MSLCDGGERSADPCPCIFRQTPIGLWLVGLTPVHEINGESSFQQPPHDAYRRQEIENVWSFDRRRHDQHRRCFRRGGSVTAQGEARLR
jgi:hypothetical protein